MKFEQMKKEQESEIVVEAMEQATTNFYPASHNHQMSSQTLDASVAASSRSPRGPYSNNLLSKQATDKRGIRFTTAPQRDCVTKWGYNSVKLWPKIMKE